MHQYASEESKGARVPLQQTNVNISLYKNGKKRRAKRLLITLTVFNNEDRIVTVVLLILPDAGIFKSDRLRNAAYFRGVLIHVLAPRSANPFLVTPRDVLVPASNLAFRFFFAQSVLVGVAAKPEAMYAVPAARLAFEAYVYL